MSVYLGTRVQKLLVISYWISYLHSYRVFALKYLNYFANIKFIIIQLGIIKQNFLLHKHPIEEKTRENRKEIRDRMEKGR